MKKLTKGEKLVFEIELEQFKKELKIIRLTATKLGDFMALERIRKSLTRITETEKKLAEY